MSREPNLIGHSDSGTTEGAIGYKLISKIRETKSDVTLVYNMIKRMSIEHSIERRLKSHTLAVLADSLWKFTQV